ncbi:MAG: inositol monophosphatase family protein [Gammaproteobacteria bacterium]
MNYLKLCYSINDAIKNHLYDDVTRFGFTGETQDDPANLKSTHDIDKITAGIATEILRDHPCNIFIESVDEIIHDNPEFSIYIDPIDGSLNWERGVGDPCVVIAISPKPKINCLNDLTFAFVYGLRSRDIYYSDLKESTYINSISNKAITLTCQGNHTISEATAYLRCGYGAAQQQLDATLNLCFAVRDIRGFDNAAIEMCEIARNAADVMVEARGISDFFNLLAYPILKTAGGVLTDLSGHELGNVAVEFSSIYNYIACNNQSLLSETVKLIKS